MTNVQRLRTFFCAIPAVFVVGSCAARASGPCAESFCLPPHAVIESRDTSAEDFNLYKVRVSGQVFTLYEGNHPQSLSNARCGSRLVPMRRTTWPAYLEINGPCTDAANDVASELATATRPR